MFLIPERTFGAAKCRYRECGKAFTKVGFCQKFCSVECREREYAAKAGRPWPPPKRQTAREMMTEIDTPPLTKCHQGAATFVCCKCRAYRSHELAHVTGGDAFCARCCPECSTGTAA